MYGSDATPGTDSDQPPMRSGEPAAATPERRVGGNPRFSLARLGAVGEILLLALPGLGVYVSGLYVEMPAFDQLFMIPFLEKVHEGSATLDDYVARWGAGGIHHIIFPRLISTRPRGMCLA